MTEYGRLSATPDIYEIDGDDKGAERMRGIPFEEFIHLRKEYTP
jgi:hypothetical protein